MENLKILVVDDELRIRRIVKDFLKKENYIVDEAENGKEALEKFRNDKYDAILLDVMMPELDGWEVCKVIRNELKSNVPIVMLTAKSEEEDELLGFKLGVDEYISKPFSPRILVARLNLLLNKKTTKLEILEYSNIQVNLTTHIVTVNGAEVNLSFKEFELLTYFINHQGVALSREKILADVWNYDYFGDARTIDTHIKTLRAKLKDAGKPEIIKTIWGMGYKLEE